MSIKEDQNGEIIDGVGELSQFYMRTEFRGQGIGNRLLKRIIEEAEVLRFTQFHATALRDKHHHSSILLCNW